MVFLHVNAPLVGAFAVSDGCGYTWSDMKFPVPPPLKTAPRQTLPTGVLNTRTVRLLTIVSIVFWMCVLGVLGLACLWAFQPLIASFSRSVVLNAALLLLFLMTGYWVGMIASRLILRDALKLALKRRA